MTASLLPVSYPWPRLAQIIIALAGLLLFAGCPSVVTKEDIAQLKSYDGKITKLGRDLEDKTLKLQQTSDKLLAKTEARLDNQEEVARHYTQFVFAARLAVDTDVQVDPRSLFIKDELNRALAGLPQIDTDMRALAEQRLKNGLSTIAADRDRLKESYAQLEAKAKTLETEKTQLNATVNELYIEKGKLVGEQNRIHHEIKVAQDERNSTSRDIIIKQQEEIARQRDDDARKDMLARLLLLAGVLVGVGAAFSVQLYPPVTLPLGAASAGLIFAAWAVVTVPTWVLILILCACGLAIAAAIYIKFSRTRDIADNSIGAIEQLKNAARDGDDTARTAYDRLKHELHDWFGDNVNNPLHQEIHNRLKSLNLLGKVVKPLK